MNIRGREYETVAERIVRFRADHATWSVVTTITHESAASVTVRCEIGDESGRVLATGHAHEVREASAINRTSALENCETSAIGRALAALGYTGHEYASADEVAGALAKQAVDAKPANGTRKAPAKKAAPSNGRSGVTVPFGRNKGKPIEDVDDRDLEYLIAAAEKTLADSSKARFHDTERIRLDAYAAELATRGGSDAMPDFPPDDDQPPPHDDSDIPF